MSSSRGQASVDYVAVLGLVVVLLALGAGAVGAPWLGPRLAGAIRHGICVVSGSLCTPSEARRAGTEPCVVHRQRRSQRVSATAVVRLGRGDTMVVERRSDGTVSVAFVDGGEAGLEAGVGLKLPVAIKGGAVASVGLRFDAGRVYELGDWPAAQRFLARFAAQERLGGEAKRALQALCLRCPDWLEGEPAARLPAPSARFHEGGVYADLAAKLGLRVPGIGDELGLGGRIEGLEVLGRRKAGARETWYLRLEGASVAELGAVFGSLAGARQAEGALEVTLEHGRPVDVRARVALAATWSAELDGARLDLDGLVDRVRGAAAHPPPRDGEGGGAVHATLGMDLREPADRQALAAVLRPGSSPLGRLEAVRALGRRFDLAGRLDVEMHRLRRSTTSHGAGAGMLLHVGAGYHATQDARDLVAAWSLREGELRRREDCEAAAAAAAAPVARAVNVAAAAPAASLRRPAWSIRATT